jgi:hypothetical protein
MMSDSKTTDERIHHLELRVTALESWLRQLRSEVYVGAALGPSINSRLSRLENARSGLPDDAPVDEEERGRVLEFKAVLADLSD